MIESWQKADIPKTILYQFESNSHYTLYSAYTLNSPSFYTIFYSIPILSPVFKIYKFCFSRFFVTYYSIWFGLVVLINVDLAIFQPYLDLEAGDNQSLKIQVARRGIEPRSSCSASQELNHSATAAPILFDNVLFGHN